MKRISDSGNRSLWLGTLGLLLAGILVACQESTEPLPQGGGVVVEEVDERTALEKAGIQAGDVLVGWQRLPRRPANLEADQGEIDSPFDWHWLVIEQAPRGTIKLRGEREGEPLVFTVEPGPWEAKVRPRMEEVMLEAYLRGQQLIAGGEVVDGVAYWHQAAGMATTPEDRRLRCWIFLRVGKVWAQARAWEGAQNAYGEAIKLAQDPLAQVVTREALGDAFRWQSQWDQAREAHRSVLEIREATWGECLGVARSWKKMGEVAAYRGDHEAAEAHFRQALAISEKLAPNSIDLALGLSWLASTIIMRGQLDGAHSYLQDAVAIIGELAPDSMPLAACLTNLARVASWRGDLEEVDAHLLRALAIVEKRAPNSVELAKVLNGLGVAALGRDDFETAHPYLRDALAIKEKLVPKSMDLSNTLNNLASLHYKRGDLAAAQHEYERGLAIVEELAPNSIELARNLNGTGIVAWERGDLALAEEYHQRAMVIKQRVAPNSLDLAVTLNNLGNLAHSRGDLALTEEYHQQALAITEKLAPNSLDLAQIYNNLGPVAEARGELSLAEQHYRSALAIQEKLAPRSIELTDSLLSLGLAAEARGDLGTAEELYNKVLAIRQELAPNSLSLAGSFLVIGRLAATRGDLSRAEEYYSRALGIRRKLAPNSIQYALNLHRLGGVCRRTDRPQQAADYLERAIKVLESQISRLGGSHERKGDFRARHREIYRATIEVQVELGQTERAFHTLERYRARSLLAMLTERDLIFTTDVPEDLEKARKVLARRHDHLLEQMATLASEKDREAIDELSKQLRDLERQRDDIAARIRELSPRLADLHYPQPLTLAQTRDALDPGTVMLSYSVGEDQTHVFVATKEKGLVAVETVAIGEEKLRRKVGDFRRAVSRGTDPRSQFFEPVTAAGRELYDLLIRPAASAIADGDRVLIIRDGPLHLLPFSALIRADGDYLAEWKPVHFVLSATLYAQLRRSRPQAREPSPMVAAFGDPVYPEILRAEDRGQIANFRVRAAVERGLFDWQPLPHTRREVEGIAALHPAERVHPYLGEEATEERAKGLARTTDIVHFAAHGYLDDRFPLNSAVVLTIPEGFPEDRDNGLLQAWEIFERVRVDADLVVLSACESGLGEERGGEGLIGLTRAFQYAGARTVAATLWNVADEVTAELMVRFYRHLRDGKSKDAALREAQIELIRDPIEVRKASGEVVKRDASAPYYWATFQVIGDWR